MFGWVGMAVGVNGCMGGICEWGMGVGGGGHQWPVHCTSSPCSQASAIFLFNLHSV